MKHFENTYARQHDSALTVNQGVEQPPVVNPHFKRVKRKEMSAEDYVRGILEGNFTVLSQAITMVESLREEHYQMAQEIIKQCLPHSGNSVRIGITGVPGAGKSTFIEAIGDLVTSMGQKLAVLAIDPSSERSKGSILGDKTRMETLVHDKNAFIRPSPSAGSLGGVARKSRETIILCEAAGYEVVFVETVGVGQSEIAVHSMVDMFLLLQISGAGDELQGIKRGIMEMADMVAITKSDSGNEQRAELAKSHFVNALNLFPTPISGWRPRVYTCSSLTKQGIREIWADVEEFMKFTKGNGSYHSNRNRQSKYWMYETINESLKESFYRNEAVAPLLESAEKEVLGETKSSFAAAHELLDSYFRSFK